MNKGEYCGILGVRKGSGHMLLKANYAVGENILVRTKTGTLHSVGGTLARETGLTKSTGELTRDERIERVINMDAISRRNPAGIKANKLYPKDNDASVALKDMMVRSVTRAFKGNILDKPEMVQEECYLYFSYCVDNKVACSLTGLSVWLGISRTHILRLRNSDKPIGEILEKASDIVAALRVSQVDHGNLNPVWNMFMLANDHKFTRSDEKNAFNIQINNQGYSNDEISNILLESDVLDDM